MRITNLLKATSTAGLLVRRVLIAALLATVSCAADGRVEQSEETDLSIADARDAVDAVDRGPEASESDPPLNDVPEEPDVTPVDVALDYDSTDDGSTPDAPNEVADGLEEVADLDEDSAPDVGESAESGPRPLPPTFVELEIDHFPRPADEACADNQSVVNVAVGESIFDAVDSAESGTTVRVQPGTYLERGDEVSAILIDTDNLCLRAAEGGEVILEQTAGTYGIGVTADDVVIEGFTLRGFGTNISLNGRTDDTQRNITIERVTIEQPQGPFIDGIAAYGDNQGMATRVPTVDGLLVIDSRVEGADLGISCNRGPCDHWWIENTTVVNRPQEEGSGADAFAIEDGRQIVVLDSTVANAGADGIDTKANDVVVYGTRVLDVGRNAIKLWRGGDVINTLVDGSGADASLVGDEAGRYRYLHVLVAHHGWPNTGAYVGTWGYDRPDHPIQLEIVNSIFFENSDGGLFVPSADGVSIRDSIFDDAASKLLDINGTVYRGSDLSDLEGLGVAEGVQIADPDFEGASDGDYRTREGSPARDAAEVITGLDGDIDGNPRGDEPDIGPIESD